jgi:hypothetical protein
MAIGKLRSFSDRQQLILKVNWVGQISDRLVLAWRALRRVDVSARSFEPFHAARESEPIGDRQVLRSRVRFEKCKHPISVGVAPGATNWYTVGAEGIS